MAENYHKLTKLVIEVSSKVLRDVLENHYKSSGFSSFHEFLENSVHKLFHTWKPELVCCDSKCFHLARRSKALLSNPQWDRLYVQKSHEHSRRYSFCPCQYTVAQGGWQDLDLMITSQILQITFTNLSTNIINAITELRRQRNFLIHLTSSNIDEIRFHQNWRSVEQAILTLAGTISRKYQQETREMISNISRRSHQDCHIFSASHFGSDESLLSGISAETETSTEISNISSPLPSSDVLILESKLKQVITSLDDIKTDISTMKRENRLIHKYSGIELERPNIPDEQYQSLEYEMAKNIDSVSERFDKQHSEVSAKLDKLVENTLDLKEKSFLQNEKFLTIDEEVGKINNKIEMLEFQNIGIQKKLDFIINISKSRHLPTYEHESSEPVSAQSARNIQDLKRHVIVKSAKTLSPRDEMDQPVVSSLPRDQTDQSMESTLPRDQKDKPMQSLVNLGKFEDDTFPGESNVQTSDKLKNVQTDDQRTLLTGKLGENFMSAKDEAPAKPNDTGNVPSLSSSFRSDKDDSVRSEPVLLRRMKKSLEEANVGRNNYSSLDSGHNDESKSLLKEQGIKSEEHKGRISVTMSGSNELLKMEYLKQTSIEEGSAYMDDPEEGSAYMDFPELLDKALDDIVQSGKLELEPDGASENESIEKMAPRSHSTSLSSGDDESFTNSNNEEICKQYINMAGLPQNKDILQIVQKGIKAHSGHPCRSKGIDTVLCLDASASMKGKTLEQLKAVALYITGYIENVAISRGLEENLAVVIFGQDTKIVQELTNDYAKIRQAIDGIAAEGTSPMLTGLLLSYIAVDIAGGATSILGHIVNPRIILLTDGRPTDDSFINNWEVEFIRKDPQVREKNIEMARRLNDKGYQIYCIAVGQSSNKEFLHQLAVESDSGLFDMDNTEYLAKYFQYHNIVGKVMARLNELDGSDECDDILRDEMSKLAPDFIQKDMDNIKEIMKIWGILENEEYPDLPPLGSRICDTSERREENMLGTVIKHLNKDQFEILWDDENVEVRDYDHNDGIDVHAVDSPVVLGPDELIRVGVRVVRGPAWKVEYGNQDGGKGSFGVVCRVTNTGFVLVRWTNGRKHKYKFDGGIEGKNEVEVHESSLPQKDHFRKIQGSIGLITSIEFLGTGFRVGDKYIMTAFHILEDIIEETTLKRPVQIKFQSEGIRKTSGSFEVFQLETTIVFFDQVLDVAVLELSTNNRPHPPAVKIFTNLLHIRQIENINIFGYMPYGYLKLFKSLALPHDDASVTNAVDFVSENYHSELETYKRLIDPNKIVLRSSHWQNGMDGSVGLIEFENEVYVACMYLKCYLSISRGEEEVQLPEEFVFGQALVFSVIKDYIERSNSGLCNMIFTSEAVLIWQWEDTTRDWVDYPTDISEKLEMAYTLNRDKTCIVTVRGQSIRILFKSMKARYITDGSTRTVRRIIKKLT